MASRFWPPFFDDRGMGFFVGRRQNPNEEPKTNIEELKKEQVQVLVGNFNDPLNDLLTEIIKEVIKDKYDLKLRVAFYGEDIVKLANRESIDIFILILNNIRFRPVYPVQERLETSSQLITQIKMTHGRPVIVLSGRLEDSWLVARTKRAVDFFFLLPFEANAFKEAIEKCLNMRPADN
jgi:hypothetical protein